MASGMPDSEQPRAPPANCSSAAGAIAPTGFRARMFQTLPFRRSCIENARDGGRPLAPPRAASGRRLSKSRPFRSVGARVGQLSDLRARRAARRRDYLIRPASFSVFSWKLAILSRAVLASSWPDTALVYSSCCSVSSSKNSGMCQKSFCQSRACRPSAIPRPERHIGRLRVDRLERALPAGLGEGDLRVLRQPPFAEVEGFLVLEVGIPGHQHERLAADHRPPAQRPCRSSGPASARRRPCPRLSKSRHGLSFQQIRSIRGCSPPSLPGTIRRS